MKLYNAILLLIIIHFFNIYISLDNLDCISIYNSLKYNYKIPYNNIRFNYYILYIYKFLLIPFYNKYYYASFTGGGFYLSYILQFKNIFILNDKLYWYNIFKKYNINHPKLYAFNKNNIINYVNYININKYYICKPINQYYGIDVKKVLGKDIDNYLLNNNNILVQDYLHDCIINKARIFRLVTLYNNKLFFLYELSVLDNNIVSNAHNDNCIFTKCDNFYCKNLSLLQNNKLLLFFKQLSNLHFIEYPYIFHIGWDIIIDCDNNDNIKIYCLEGNIFAGIWNNFYKNDYNLIDDYKKEFKIFIELNKKYFI